MSGGFLQNLLPWLLPPVLGAIIGYVTNFVAIKMLFRPLTAKRIFGIRIPMTPGIIPKQRHSLADSIGRMVSDQLINEETLINQISSEGFRSGVHRNIAALSEKLLNMPLSGLNREQWSIFYQSLESYLAGTLKRFFTSDRFHEAIRSLLTEIVESLSGKTLSEITDREKLHGFIEARILPLLSEKGKLRTWLFGEMKTWIATKLRQNASLDTLIPEEIVSSAAAGFKTLLPSLTDSLIKYLRSDPVRKEIEIKGRFLLRDILDKLNNFQKFFISVAQYDRTLEEKMPEIVAEALDYLEESALEPDNQEKIAAAVQTSLMRWRKQGLADVVYSANIDLEEKAEIAGNKILDLLKGDGAGDKIIAFVDSFLDRNGSRSLLDIVNSELGFSSDEVIQYIFNPIQSYLSRPGSSEVVANKIISLAESFLQNNGDLEIGELLSIDEVKKERLDSYLSAKLLDVLKARLPNLIESFNIQKIVVDKVNQLDVVEVEKLLLMVIARHLKWINVFGAILGAFIGFTQVIINLLR
jgi:uncharacterized membrane protein YheB (UPF0754 family)